MKSMRAKVELTGVTPVQDGTQENLEFRGVAKNGAYPEDGSDENNTFAKFSPCVDFRMTVANPALLGVFKPGQQFYVDFMPIPDVATEEVQKKQAKEEAAE